MEPVVVIDFETTGLSPAQGGRATEIGAVLLHDGQIVDRYHSLMNGGCRIPPSIEAYTGITNAMIRAAPSAARVMAEVADFVGDLPLIAHNAAFDRAFWDAELARVGRRSTQAFACSMRVARRVLPEAPNHRLGTLIAHTGLPVTGRYHRALADAEMTAHLTLHLERSLMQRFGLRAVTHALLQRIQCAPRGGLEQCLRGLRND
jgi:DNA polymerase III subunit epsilon